LMIVESPNKIKKISGFLGEGWQVAASCGHIRDLPAEQDLGIEVRDGRIIPQYVTLSQKKDIIARLRALADKAEEIFLATDPDREGEAIAWHISEVLGRKHAGKCKRVTFHEITRNAVLAALRSPRALDAHLVDAQQARRILDRIVGWVVSPTCARGTGRADARSAGRVQSVALRLVVEREEAILAFVPQTYYAVRAQLESPPHGVSFWSVLRQWRQQAGQPWVPVERGLATEAEAKGLMERLKQGEWVVEECQKKEVEIRPPAPFTTSSVTQAASVQLRWRPDKTMQVLQELFESGLITYHRTDSTHLSPEAVNEIRAYIAQQYDAAYLPSVPWEYKQSAHAQEAHEAIRPTHIQHLPEQVEGDAGALYRMIWQRTLMCQMAAGKDEQTGVWIAAGFPQAPIAKFQARGVVRLFDGWRVVVAAAQEEESAEAEESDAEQQEDAAAPLPPLEEQQRLRYKQHRVTKGQTKPPPRFTQAALVRELERRGVGRPSTYAAILSKILDRGYVTEEKRKLKPTEVGVALIQFLRQAYTGDFIDLEYTAQMEEILDRIASGSQAWEPFIQQTAERLLQKSAAVGYPYTTLQAVAQARGAVPSQPDLPESFPRPETTKPCKQCQEPIGWAQHQGRWVPVDPDGSVHRCARRAEKEKDGKDARGEQPQKKARSAPRTPSSGRKRLEGGV
ncbi:MAG: type I DNA topoisomerase, partial [Rectinema sp.]|nr:type I DNA topoisomerase [Rectinema sp.]